MSDAFLSAARAAYVDANRGTLNWMLDRPRTHGAFLNTKQNSITLADYTDADGWRGPRYLYGWIQGRGLEALVTHAGFFETEDPALATRLDAAGRALYAALKQLYDSYGAAYFTYDEALVPVMRGADGTPRPQALGTPFFTYSDAFVLKGLVAAASRYEPAARPRFLKRMAALVAAIEEGRFIMDEQQELSQTAADRQPPEFGPRMIVLGAASLLHRLGLDADAAFGIRFIDHVLAMHWDRDGSLLVRDEIGGDRCNVGHAIELSGFALDYLPEGDARVDDISRLLLASCAAGFGGPGLCLHVSASTGAHLSRYYPWWNLPEATRAASLCYARTGDAAVLAAWRKMHEAFFANYWRGTPPIAYQTRDRDGPVDYVPATPDLDPGYHTGLSFLGAIEGIDAVRGR